MEAPNTTWKKPMTEIDIYSFHACISSLDDHCIDNTVYCNNDYQLCFYLGVGEDNPLILCNNVVFLFKSDSNVGLQAFCQGVSQQASSGNPCLVQPCSTIHDTLHMDMSASCV